MLQVHNSVFHQKLLVKRIETGFIILFCFQIGSEIIYT